MSRILKLIGILLVAVFAIGAGYLLAWLSAGSLTGNTYARILGVVTALLAITNAVGFHLIIRWGEIESEEIRGRVLRKRLKKLAENGRSRSAYRIASAIVCSVFSGAVAAVLFGSDQTPKDGYFDAVAVALGAVLYLLIQTLVSLKEYVDLEEFKSKLRANLEQQERIGRISNC